MQETELKFRFDGLDAQTRFEEFLGEPLARLALATRYWLPNAPSGAALRLREAGGAVEASVKRSDAAPDDGLFISEELSERLDAGTAVEFISGARLLQELPLVRRAGLQGPFRYVGLILTRRHIYRIGDLPLEVDRVTYPDGGEDYELEVETPDAGTRRGEIAALARRAGITLEPSNHSKLGRLLRRINHEPRP